MDRLLQELTLLQRERRAAHRIGIGGAEGEMLGEELGATRGAQGLFDSVQGDAIRRIQGERAAILGHRLGALPRGQPFPSRFDPQVRRVAGIRATGG